MHFSSLRALAASSVALTAIILALVVPTAALALSAPPSGLGDPLIVGTSAYVQTSSGLKMRNLITGKTSTLPLPDRYASWNELPVATGGHYAAAGGSPGGTVFATSQRSGFRLIEPAVTSPEPCQTRAQVLSISRSGRLRVLYVAFATKPPQLDCEVDAAASRLVEIDPAGNRKELWLPEAYRSWLQPEARLGDVAMRGSKLLIARSAVGDRSGGLVVLDVVARKVLRKIDGGRHFDHASFAGHGLLTTEFRRISGRSAWYRPDRGTKRLIHRGAAGYTSCGGITAVSGSGSIELRSSHGRRLYRRSFRGDYASTSVSCSAEVLHYKMSPNYPEMGDSRADGLPKPHSRTLLLRRLR